MPIHKSLYSQDSNEWCTPLWLFELLDNEFGFKLDAAATDDNTLCENYYTKEEDGLTGPWHPYTTYVNPPYSGYQTALKWLTKAYAESVLGCTVVMLLPARTSNIWFHNFALKAAEIRFVDGRLRFQGANNSAPFPSMVVIFKHGITYPIIGPSINARRRT